MPSLYEMIVLFLVSSVMFFIGNAVWILVVDLYYSLK